GNATVDAPTGLTNAGTITLTSPAGCAYWALLSAPAAQSIASSGLIRTQAGGGGIRYLRANPTNTGPGRLGAAESDYDRAGVTLQNLGALGVNNGSVVKASSNAIVNGTGGSITGTATGQLVLTGGSFTQGAGAISGPDPLILRSSDAAF